MILSLGCGSASFAILASLSSIALATEDCVKIRSVFQPCRKSLFNPANPATMSARNLMQHREKRVKLAFALAAERYATLGVDVKEALRRLAAIPISLHCWQGDDVGGFETFGGTLTGGIVATGNYPGKARTPGELRADAAKALSLIPGTHRFNLHAFYGEFGGKRIDRNEIEPRHFKNWIDWARSLGVGL